MLPLGSLTVVRATDLRAGDLAFAPSIDRYIIVGAFNEYELVATLTNESDVVLAEPHDFSGFVTRITGWEIEVDERSLAQPQTSERRIGSLAISGQRIGVVGLPSQRTGFRIITIGGGEEGRDNFIFERWRLIVRDGAEKIVLYSRS